MSLNFILFLPLNRGCLQHRLHRSQPSVTARTVDQTNIRRTERHHQGPICRTLFAHLVVLPGWTDSWCNTICPPKWHRAAFLSVSSLPRQDSILPPMSYLYHQHIPSRRHCRRQHVVCLTESVIFLRLGTMHACPGLSLQTLLRQPPPDHERQEDDHLPYHHDLIPNPRAPFLLLFSSFFRSSTGIVVTALLLLPDSFSGTRSFPRSSSSPTLFTTNPPIAQAFRTHPRSLSNTLISHTRYFL